MGLSPQLEHDFRSNLGVYLTLCGMALGSPGFASEPMGANAYSELRVIEFPLHTDPSGVPLTVELNRLQIADPEFPGAGIDLGFLRFRSQHPGTPVILIGDDDLESSSLASGRANILVQALLASGDVIALDRRGIGTSSAQSPCLRAIAYALDAPLEAAPFAQALGRWMVECGTFWADEGLHLDQFSLPYAVRDVDRVRNAIGAERVVIIGYGSGAEIAWGAAAAEPDRVIGVVELIPPRTYPISASKLPRQIKVVTDAASVTVGVGNGDLLLASADAHATAAIDSGDWDKLGVFLIDSRSRIARPNPARIAFDASLPATYDAFLSDAARRVIEGRSIDRPQIRTHSIQITNADVEDPGVIDRVSAFVASAAKSPDTPPRKE